MITDRTLHAYEQFCENYYEDFARLNRSYLDKAGDSLGVADFPTGHLSDKRKDNLRAANDALFKLDILHPRRGNLATYTGGGRDAHWAPTPKQMDKLKMKRDPEYREKRLAEIADRKAKNRADSERGIHNRKVNDLVRRLNNTVK